MLKKGMMLLFVLSTIVTFAIYSDAEGNDLFGAVAYSNATTAYGFSYDYDNRKQADGRALQECENQSNNSGDCKVLLWFKNSCGSLAAGDGGVGTGWGVNKQVAEKYALESCTGVAKNCRIIKTVCNQNANATR